MYIIIHRDKAEEVKHKLRKMKEFTDELLECVESAPHHNPSEVDIEFARRTPMHHYPEHEEYVDPYYHPYEHELARGRGRGRMGRY